jgi:hypothetical protein
MLQKAANAGITGQTGRSTSEKDLQQTRSKTFISFIIIIIFAIGAVSLNHIYTHESNSFNIVCWIELLLLYTDVFELKLLFCIFILAHFVIGHWAVK